MKKSKLFKELNFLPTKELRTQINLVISANRVLDIKEAKYKKILRPNEVQEIRDFFGV